jgi:hypothetical protein
MRRHTQVAEQILRRVVKHPSAFFPLVMSMSALAIVLGHITVYGPARQADEGAAAHLWQLLMALELPLILFFTIKWWRRAPRQALGVLALQAGAALASMAPVLILGL